MEVVCIVYKDAVRYYAVRYESPLVTIFNWFCQSEFINIDNLNFWLQDEYLLDNNQTIHDLDRMTLRTRPNVPWYIYVNKKPTIEIMQNYM